MRILSVLFLLAVAIVSLPGNAFAGVVAKISLSQQNMQVYVNGLRKYNWPVSTARSGYRTPTGSYSPIRMYKSYYSIKYHGSPMPYSIFFYGGYAIHGTNYISSLGRPASHGCIRLHPSNAAALYSLVQQHGPRNTQIVITR
jgi:lipoprotein-anchoring transpeptidase ErfK/SrfK